MCDSSKLLIRCWHRGTRGQRFTAGTMKQYHCMQDCVCVCFNCMHRCDEYSTDKSVCLRWMCASFSTNKSLHQYPSYNVQIYAVKTKPRNQFILINGTLNKLGTCESSVLLLHVWLSSVTLKSLWTLLTNFYWVYPLKEKQWINRRQTGSHELQSHNQTLSSVLLTSVKWK